MKDHGRESGKKHRQLDKISKSNFIGIVISKIKDPRTFFNNVRKAISCILKENLVY